MVVPGAIVAGEVVVAPLDELLQAATSRSGVTARRVRRMIMRVLVVL